jgi:hypothetical protein
MALVKQFKRAEKRAVEQQQVISELNALVKSIERCETTIVDLKNELESVNLKHQGRKTTREDIDYLTDLLKCANKKLAWEKNMAGLQKRTPLILQRMSDLINDPQSAPDDPRRAEMLRALQGVQAAMDRLQNLKLD